MARSRVARAPRKPLGCHDRALGLLAARPRTRRELEMRLLRAGFPAEEVRDEIDRLERVGLLDDEAFAASYVEHAAGVRRAGHRAVRSGLLGMGVPREIVDRAVAGLDGDDEGRARSLAISRAARLSGLERDVAFRRLVSFLARRGYDHEVALRAASAALALEGSEEPD